MSPTIIIKILSCIPFALSRPIANLLGNLSVIFNSRNYQITLENLALCLPELDETERKELARRSLQETSKVIFETAHVWTKSRAWSLQHFIKETNKELLSKALASEKTTILLAPHLGNWEMFGPYLAEQKKITIMYLPPEDEALHQLIVNSRESVGIQLAPANRKGVLLVFKAAKNGEFIGILPDQEPDLESGEFAPFFNQPALTMTLVHKLIQRSDCTVVMGYAKRIPGGFEAVFREPDETIYSEDSATSLAGLNRSVESCVREVPEQYQWEYKRFKQHPSGEKKVFYRKHK
jgi:Kdo2-lipid IVA lauroyltransferase/acyltransferase